MTTWVSTAEVRTRLAVDGKPLGEKRLRALLPAETTTKAWINNGTAERPHYVWDVALVDAWYAEACAWRQSRSGASGISSGGKTLTASGRAKAASPAKPRQTPSVARSRTQSQQGSGGSLASLAQRLCSPTS